MVPPKLSRSAIFSLLFAVFRHSKTAPFSCHFFSGCQCSSKISTCNTTNIKFKMKVSSALEVGANFLPNLLSDFPLSSNGMWANEIVWAIIPEPSWTSWNWSNSSTFDELWSSSEYDRLASPCNNQIKKVGTQTEKATFSCILLLPIFLGSHALPWPLGSLVWPVTAEILHSCFRRWKGLTLADAAWDGNCELPSGGFVSFTARINTVICFFKELHPELKKENSRGVILWEFFTPVPAKYLRGPF